MQCNCISYVNFFYIYILLFLKKNTYNIRFTYIYSYIVFTNISNSTLLCKKIGVWIIWNKGSHLLQLERNLSEVLLMLETIFCSLKAVVKCCCNKNIFGAFEVDAHWNRKYFVWFKIKLTGIKSVSTFLHPNWTLCSSKSHTYPTLPIIHVFTLCVNHSIFHKWKISDPKFHYHKVCTVSWIFIWCKSLRILLIILYWNDYLNIFRDFKTNFKVYFPQIIINICI